MKLEGGLGCMRYTAIVIIDGCKPLKMGVFRKPRFSTAY